MHVSAEATVSGTLAALPIYLSFDCAQSMRNFLCLNVFAQYDLIANTTVRRHTVSADESHFLSSTTHHSGSHCLHGCLLESEQVMRRFLCAHAERLSAPTAHRQSQLMRRYSGLSEWQLHGHLRRRLPGLPKSTCCSRSQRSNQPHPWYVRLILQETN